MNVAHGKRDECKSKQFALLLHGKASLAGQITRIAWRSSKLRTNARTARGVLLSLFLVYSILGGLRVARGQAPCSGPSSVRPILFVPGILEDSSAWGPTNTAPGLRANVRSSLSSHSGYSNTSNYDLYLDWTQVRLSKDPVNTASDPLATGNIPCDARFFTIRFFGYNGDPYAFDPVGVANVSVVTKAYELSQIIKAITAATYVKDVIVVAHSLGAMDSRSYLEGLGSSSLCNSLPCAIASSRVPYTGDVAQLITVDGVNAGANAAYLGSFLLGPLALQAINVQELEPNSSIIQALNYNAPYTDASGTSILANNLPTGVTALVSYFSDQTWDVCALSFLPSCGSDGVVQTDSQSIQAPLRNYQISGIADFLNSYRSDDQSISADANCTWAGITDTLHLLPCLADFHQSAANQPGDILRSIIVPNISGAFTQINFEITDASGQTYTGPISFTLSGPTGAPTSATGTVPLVGPSAPVSTTVPYILTYQSGGPTGQGTPSILGVDAFGNVCSPTCYIMPGNWSISFHVSFTGATVSKPSAVTQTATGLAGDGATLAATVNPNGAATKVWFEWGSTTALGSVTPQRTIATGTSAVPFTASIGGLASNGTYFYRVDASNSAGNSTGNTLQFTTLSTLPKPALLTPANGAAYVSTAPLFTWTAISGATSYRIMVATTASVLPLAATSSTCGVGCLIDDTPLGTSYTPQAGVLASGTQYFWQVHARSPLQYGDWSTVSSFTPGQPSISALSISPSGTIAGGSFTTITATLSGPAPSGGALVRLSDSNSTAYPVPANITVPSGSLSGTATVQAGATSVSTTVTVNGNYNGTKTTSLTLAPSSAAVMTNAATNITSYYAYLNGSVNPQGSSGTAYFQFGTDSTFSNCANYRQTASVAVPTGSTAQAISFSTTTTSGYSSCGGIIFGSSLKSGTTYYYRMIFQNSSSGQTQYGSVQPFSTLATPVTTGTATSVTSSGALLNGTINPGGSSGTAYFQFGADSSFGTCTNYRQTSSVPVPASLAIQVISLGTTTTSGYSSCGGTVIGSSLKSGTTYYYRTVFTNSNNSEIQYGLVQSFITPTTPVTSDGATNVTSSSATLNGTVNPEGSSGSANFQFGTDSAFSTCTNYRNTASVAVPASSTAQVISFGTTTTSGYASCGGTIFGSSLKSGTTYYYRTVFTNSNNSETQYGPVVSFTTPTATPTVTVTPSSSSVTTTAALSVTISVAGGSGNPTATGTVGLSSGTYSSGTATLSGGSATINIPAGSLSPGTDTLTANYTPDSAGSSSYSTSVGTSTVAVTSAGKTTPMMAVTPSLYNITTAQNLSVTIAVTGTPTPTGTVKLSGGGYTSSPTTLSGGSIAISIPAGALSIGGDALTAVYTPDSSSTATYNSASGSSSIVTVAKATAAVTITPSSSSITTAQPLTVIVTISGGSGNPTPTGSVTLTSGGYSSVAAILTGGSATINIPAGSLTSGSDLLTISYTGDIIYSTVSGSAPVTVTTSAKTTPTVTATPSLSSITTAQALGIITTVNGSPAPTGAVTLTSGSFTSTAVTLNAGSATITIPAGSLALGSDTLIVTYIPDSSSTSIFNSASGTAVVTVAIPPKTVPTMTMTQSLLSITTAQSLSVTVGASGGNGNPVPTGSVTLTSGTYTSGATVLSSGNSTFTIPAGALALGGDTLTAIFTPDSISSSIYSSASGAASINVTAQANPVYSGTVPPQAVGIPSPIQTVSIPFSGSFNIGSISAVTQGNTGLDYTTVSGGTCSVGGAYASGSTCTVNYTFTPTAPGQRLGAILIYDSTSPTPILEATVNLSGIGDGPLTALTPGLITTAAGNGTQGYSGDNGLASGAELDYPVGVAVDASGNLYVADAFQHNEIREVNGTTGNITTVAGNGTQGALGDNGPATNAGLCYPEGMALDGTGNLYIADLCNNRIRKVAAGTGIITTVAGNGTQGFSGDNGLATNAELNQPQGVAVDASGNLYIADAINNRVRKVSAATSIITTVAGKGTSGFSGDNGIATDAELSGPSGVALDSYGNLYIADQANNRVREVAGSTGIITTVAGNGTAGYSGDSGPATSGELNGPFAVELDTAGNLYIVDVLNNCVRKVSAATGIITTVAGNGTRGYSGDSGPATHAELALPNGVALDGSGNLYIADTYNARVRKVAVATSAISFASTAVGAASTDSPQSVTLSNIGNTNLIASVPSSGTNASIANNFTFSGSTTCPDSSTGGTLGGGTDCLYSINFTPTAVGTITGSAVLVDNALVSTQTISLIGTGVVITPTITVTPSLSSITTVQTLSVTVTASNGTGSPTPTGSVILASGTYASAATALTNGSIIITIPAGSLAVGSDTLTVTYTPDNSSSSIYNGASGTTAINVTTPTPTITFTVPNHTYGDAPFTVSATSNSSGAITYSVVSGPANISGSTVTLTGAGTVVLQASQAAAGGYTLGTQTATFTATGQVPTITFTVPNHTYGDASFTVAATSNSSGALSYSLVSGPATVSGSTVTLTGAGTVVLLTSQIASGGYTSGTQTATFTVASAIPTIAFAVPNHSYGDAAFTVSATSNSSGAISYSVVSGSATLSNSTVTLTGAGTVVLQASQAAAGSYGSSAQTATFAVAKGSQAITFTAPTTPVNYGAGSVTLSASASSGLPVAFSVLSGPGSVSGSNLNVTGAGTVVVAADQAGNANYASAAQVTRSITVNKIAPAAGLTASPNPVLAQSVVTLTATVSSSVSTPTGSVVFSEGSTTLGTANLRGGIATLTISTLTAGTHSIAAVYGGDPNFNSISSAAVSETVQDFTLTVGGSGSSQTVAPGGTATFTLPMSPTGGTTFPAAVTFLASGLPPGFTAGFNPTGLIAGSSATNVALVIQVPATAMLEKNGLPGRGLPLVALGMLMLPFVGGLRRSTKRLQRIAIVLIALAGVGCAAALTGCGGGGSGSSGGGGTQPRVYTVTVTATSGTLSHATTLTLTVP